MFLKARLFVSFGRSAALLFLAFAVFGWGLQAKLELYKPASLQKPFGAKLLTERRLVKVASTIEQKDKKQIHPPILAFAFLFHFLLTTLAPQSTAQEVKIGFSYPGKPYLHGAYSLNLPPPSLL